MKIHQFIFDGIGTSGTTSKVIDFAAYTIENNLRAVGADVTTEWAEWPASMFGAVGGNESWASSSLIAEKWLGDRMDQIGPDDKVILLAFSGGNKPVHDWLDRNKDRLDQIAAVGFASDPFRPQDKQQSGMPALQGWGICGQKPGPIPHKSFWVGVPGDDITAAAPDLILRTPADVSKGFPADVIGGLVKAVSSGNLQLAYQIGLARKNPLAYLFAMPRRINEARDAIVRYGSGYHTTHYRDPWAGGDSPMVRFGNTIAYKVKRDNGLLNPS